MPSNSSIDLTTLDFDSQVQALKNHLKSQEIFRDYDFEGSNLKVLIELLSYNSFKNAFLVNMLFSEGFLDSAQLLSSAISHAKKLNYVPRSYRSAVARVRVTFTATSEHAPYIIRKGQPFTTIVKSKSYTFTNPETLIVSSTNTSFSFETDIYEGNFLQDTYTFRAGVENQRFRVTNPNIDTRSIAVVVYEDNKTVGDTYRLSSSLLDVSATSKVYFIQGAEDGTYEILFGDGNIGYQPKDNSLIVIEYRVSGGTGPNGAKKFTTDFDVTGGYAETLSTPVTNVLEIARDGSERESIDSIRYYAPRHFQVQERAVTAQDYEISLQTQFPEILAVHAFGGEELDPPQYGRVIVSLALDGVNGLPDSKRREYYSFLKRRTPFTIDPVFVEAEYSYLSVDTLVRYNVNVTAASSETIKTLVMDAVLTYRNLHLNDFNSILRYSKLSGAIDEADPSIVSSITEVSIYKKISPILGEKTNFNINFAIPLRNDFPGKTKIHKVQAARTLWSSPFLYSGDSCTIEDDGDGTVRIIKVNSLVHETIIDIGTIDYDTGKVSLVDFAVDSFVGDYLKIYALPRDPDVVVSQHTILTIEDAEVSIGVQEIRE